MKVLYDNQIFIMQKFGGISNYFANLVKVSRKKIFCKLPFMLSSNVYLTYIDIKSSQLLENVSFRGKSRLLSVINKLINIITIRSYSYDVLHPTYYQSYVLNYKKSSSKLVITVYDMIHEKFPQFFHEDCFEYKSKKILCQSADKIIAISECTKHDLVELFDIDESKIDVIHLATNFSPNKEITVNLDWLPDRYILFVGSRGGYKNFEWMLNSIAKTLVEFDVKLLVIGSPFNLYELKLISKLNIENYVICNNVYDDNSLQRIYSQSLFFIFPSLYEGFGIPILEGFASGTPVLLTNASCFPEIAEDAALYFEPDNNDDFVQKVELLLNSSELRYEFIERGFKRLKKFSWEKCADETLLTYQRTLN